MLKSNTKLIKNSEVEFSNSLVCDVDCIDTITTQEGFFGNLILKFRLIIDDYDKLHNINDIGDITFFDWVGFGDEFKQVFSEFTKHTTYNKAKISNELRHDICCHAVFSDKIEFSFVISKSYLREK